MLVLTHVPQELIITQLKLFDFKIYFIILSLAKIVWLIVLSVQVEQPVQLAHLDLLGMQQPLLVKTNALLDNIGTLLSVYLVQS